MERILVTDGWPLLRVRQPDRWHLRELMRVYEYLISTRSTSGAMP
jgi:hypothetical protein